MHEWADFSVEEAGGRTTVVVTGPLLVSTIAYLDDDLRDLEGPVQFVDISAASPIDTVGAWVIYRFAAEHNAEVLGASEQAEVLLEAVEESASTADVAPRRGWFWQRVPAEVGAMVFELGRSMRRNLGFMGAIIAALLMLFRHPGRFRVRALVRQMELVGVTSLPIIGLMSFLVGIVIAQQGAIQLREFGAEIYTINLTGRISLRELGILMTAIMVAGRSGSAFAAQIGTMQLTEEIDAMRTIGVAPVEALVIPRVLAAMLMMPLLGFYAAVTAIIGGAVISQVQLGIPFLTFLSRIQEVVPVTDLWVGLVKAPVFGLIIALSGCYQGMQVRGNAEEVGLRTTRAVVQAIFMVIVLDAFFAVFFTEIGWG
ncbi:MlaE family ABC transporter permease [Alteraurantiacibacter aquimixticola]|uniref:ABC transporter permease n=1 Tax=Alteraurantiacibacter aquimixticola TaxID=2489173 RepID=A0A4T3F235_9SPHN|nr:ABC transporter permease [Alteraurantiacibacter aquimixticola]TIX51293.1 ABC transporter permease [Alteraurantiacibacter aquimixticola]